MGKIVRWLSSVVDKWIPELSNIDRRRKKAISIFADSMVVVISLWLAYTLRQNAPFTDISSTWYLFVLVPPATILIAGSFGIYRWMIRSSNRKLFFRLAMVCFLSSAVLAFITFLLPPDRINPRSIVVIFWLLLTCGTFSIRFLWLSLFDRQANGEPVAIYGAGFAGQSLLQSLNQASEFRPVLMLDDNPALDGTTIGGIGVRNPDQINLGETLGADNITRVILAMPSISTGEYSEKVELLKQAGLTVQTIPTYAELVAGSAKMEQVRDISISDILGRSEVPPNVELLGQCVRGQVVLVTGAGGSIGSELCRQIIAQSPAKIIALDHSEENLYKLTEEFTERVEAGMQSTIYEPVLCSVNDSSAIDTLLFKHPIATIFHAAAYKHVPIIEAQPEQGTSVNVFGTLGVLDAAIKHQVANFVFISTDKAVRPTNSMGATKRVAELVLQAKAQLPNRTKISMVRFGNVLGSSGSVVPKFKKQIEKGGPITLTHPDITRYFMTIPEAAQLVLQASAIAKGGDVFVLDMGEPVRIEDLAISMIRTSGKNLKRETGREGDIEIEVLGLRPGEKMYEELFISNSCDTTEIKKVSTADEAWMDWALLSPQLEILNAMCQSADREALRKKLLVLAFYGQKELVDSQLVEDGLLDHRVKSSNKEGVLNMEEAYGS